MHIDLYKVESSLIFSNVIDALAALFFQWLLSNLSVIDRQLTVIWQLTLYLEDQICNSPKCQPYNSYNVSSEKLVLDQLIIPKLIFFFILITYLVDIVLML